jgi:uncharacterized surface protein with fasciclin (FAS1) repeats
MKYLIFFVLAVACPSHGRLLGRYGEEPFHMEVVREGMHRGHAAARQGPAPPRPNLAQLAEQLNLTKFVEVLESTSVGHVINHEGPYTVFAPTNDAFTRIPAWAKDVPMSDLMKFHVARGDYFVKELKDNMLIRTLLSKRDVRINFYKGADGKEIVTCNGRTLNQTDFDAHNGVLHIVDDVMYAVYERQGTAFSELSRIPGKDTKTLQRALDGVELDDVLNGQGPFTLFAPTDNAFSKLPDDVVKFLLKNETAMKEVLLHHVVPATWYSAGLIDGMGLKAADGLMLSVKIAGTVTVDGAEVSLPDFTVGNGVIHVIESVMIPKGVIPNYNP